MGRLRPVDGRVSQMRRAAGYVQMRALQSRVDTQAGDEGLVTQGVSRLQVAVLVQGTSREGWGMMRVMAETPLRICARELFDTETEAREWVERMTSPGSALESLNADVTLFVEESYRGTWVPIAQVYMPAVRP